MDRCLFASISIQWCQGRAWNDRTRRIPNLDLGTGVALGDVLNTPHDLRHVADVFAALLADSSVLFV